MQNKWVVGNWKMNGSLELVTQLGELLKSIKLTRNLIVCPPFPFLFAMAPYLKDGVSLGGQNCHELTSGAFTGEISAQQLKSMGCSYVVVGHSERRHYYQEDDEVVFQKAETAQGHRLIPIICVGESAAQRKERQTQDVIRKSLSRLQSLDLANCMVAYEPLWAIGTGVSATLQEINEVHQFIHTLLPGVPVLYGGSVTSSNAKEILDSPYVQGVLVGGASLKLDEFKKIITS